MPELNKKFLLGAATAGEGGGISTLPIASADTLGCVKVGNNLSITEDGVLSAIGCSGSDTPSMDWYTGNAGNTITIKDVSDAAIVEVYKNGRLLQPGENVTSYNFTGGSNDKYVSLVNTYQLNSADTWYYQGRFKLPASRAEVGEQGAFFAYSGTTDNQGPVLGYGVNSDSLRVLLSSDGTGWDIGTVDPSNPGIHTNVTFNDWGNTYDIRFGYENGSYYIDTKLASSSNYTRIWSYSNNTKAYAGTSLQLLNAANGNFNTLYNGSKVFMDHVKIVVDGEIKFDGSNAVLGTDYTNTNCTAEQVDSVTNDYAISGTTLTLKDALTSADTICIVTPSSANTACLTAIVPFVQDFAVQEFNTRQAVDASDLLQGTGSYHALALDLSANEDLDKLTAKGTATSTGNLSSVLVSNKAPFDSALSPQLDVSYTGLNKTALVNLFNSMPYNVGYSVTGSPIITDGVASGFSGNDYLKSSKNIPSYTSFEIQTTFTFGADIASVNQGILLEQNANMRLWKMSGESFIKLRFYDNTTSDIRSLATSYAVQASTTYKCKVVFANSKLELFLYDASGQLLDSNSISNVSPKIEGQLLIGSIGTSSSYFSGSIDVANTSVSFDGVPWFRGAAATTKTCSIVGCTGTDDLTTSDKNIALDKGWELTVA